MPFVFLVNCLPLRETYFHAKTNSSPRALKDDEAKQNYLSGLYHGEA
jgi:hypothetical protein